MARCQERRLQQNIDRSSTALWPSARLRVCLPARCVDSIIPPTSHHKAVHQAQPHKPIIRGASFDGAVRKLQFVWGEEITKTTWAAPASCRVSKLSSTAISNSLDVNTSFIDVYCFISYFGDRSGLQTASTCCPIQKEQGQVTNVPRGGEAASSRGKLPMCLGEGKQPSSRARLPMCLGEGKLPQAGPGYQCA